METTSLPKKLVIGSDHGGFELKTHLIHYLSTRYPNITVIDAGTHSSASVDYPDMADQTIRYILDGKADAGILICGTGIGISIRANRHKGIRAALVYDNFSAQMSKAHNNANVLCLGGRTVSPEKAAEMVQLWLETPFEGGRHQNRLLKLDQ